MTSKRLPEEFDDDKTYPVILGGRIREVSGSVINARIRSSEQYQTRSLQERVERLESLVSQLMESVYGR